jgi:hypothetical protein
LCCSDVLPRHAQPLHLLFPDVTTVGYCKQTPMYVLFCIKRVIPFRTLYSFSIVGYDTSYFGN